MEYWKAAGWVLKEFYDVIPGVVVDMILYLKLENFYAEEKAVWSEKNIQTAA